jgi:hypothetical protein
MEGKFWMAAAATAAGPELEEHANQLTDDLLQQYGLSRY